MKVLIISRNAWDTTNSIGNTLSNFFGDLKDVEFANIYFRSSMPRNQVCTHYYRVTEGELLRKWFSRNKIGKYFQGFFAGNEDQSVTETESKREKSTIRFIQKHKLGIAYKISDYLWNRKKWINGKLDAFITTFQPDIVFSFVKAAPQYYLTIRYLREKFQIPLFTWIADDEYTGFLHNGQDDKIEKLRYILNQSSIVCGCSKQICDYYNSIFGCEASPLYKGCSFSELHKSDFAFPIKMVYAGNLLYGRLKIVQEIAESIDKIDQDKNSILFEIYSNTALSELEQRYFDNLKCTKYLGKKSYDLVKNRMQCADIVLHAEAFEKEQILKTKYSFSTKIIDCMQSGSVMLAVGPSELASIDYVKHIPGAYVIDDFAQIFEGISKLVVEYDTFDDRARAIRSFAEKHHDSTMNADKIMKLMKMIVGKEL